MNTMLLSQLHLNTFFLKKMSSNNQKFHSSGPLNPIHFQNIIFRSYLRSPVLPLYIL